MQHISLTISGITKLFLACCFLVGCSSIDKKPDQLPTPPFERVYNFNYNNVWRAAQLALGDYPLRLNDQDLGILETETVRSYEGFKPPHTRTKYSPGTMYRINIKVIKGVKAGEPAVKVIVYKNLKRYRDFFSAAESLKSDGLEEAKILYRIERELVIERAINRFGQS